MRNTISRINLQNVAEACKLKILKICHLYMTQIFTYFKFRYISSSIKMFYTLKYTV